ncbi:MAG: Gfo/Idh/MocA family oxidoreductase [Dehalococcoidales bacterium]|nr:Gfo/Idh/MocA family oxidoreductase [Dehalococcoidales bacterium]
MQRGAKKYRAGIVGCGRIGSEFDTDPKRKTVSTHAGAYSASDAIELVAVSDLNEEKLVKCGRRWGITSLYQDYKKMLAEQNLDIISICTWNSTHLDIVKEALNNGVKAVFCEKPIADALKNADEMVKRCDEKGVILQIDHQRRFDRVHQSVRDYIQGGKLGNIQQATFYYTAGIANTGSHMLDLLRFFFGDADWVQALYSQVQAPNPDDPNIEGMVKFRNGVFCSLKPCDVSAYNIFEMDCLGTKGRLKITRSGYDLEYYEARESDLFSGYKELFQSKPPLNKDAPREFMTSAVSHLVECLKEGGQSVSSGQDGRAALELICACHESARADGKRITLPLKDSKIRIISR